MSITAGPAPIIAALLGLFATGAFDFVGEDGGVQPLGWAPFVFSLVLVARDTLFWGSFRAGRRPGVPGVDLHDGQIRLKLFDFEPVASTLAIITGLLASGAIDFLDDNGGGSAWAWAAFALALFLTIGGRLNRRPRSPKQRNEHARDRDARAAAFFEEMMRGVLTRRPPRR